MCVPGIEVQVVLGTLDRRGRGSAGVHDALYNFGPSDAGQVKELKKAEAAGLRCEISVHREEVLNATNQAVKVW